MNDMEIEFKMTEFLIYIILTTSIIIFLVKIYKAKTKKEKIYKKIIIVMINVFLMINLLIFDYSHKTYFKYNDWAILGSKIDDVREKYGEFDRGNIKHGESGKVAYYIYQTNIEKYVQGIYGVTFKEDNGIYTDLDVLLDDTKKVEVIKKLIIENNNDKEIIYFGDGLTDKKAFEYVHSIGGKNIFIKIDENSILKYNKLNEKNIINKCFEPDYSENSKIRNYIKNEINK